MKHSPNLLLGFGAAVGIGVCIWAIAARDLTATESLLISVLLTISAMMGSWVLSRVYSEASFNEHLRVFALKAAEKVNNLSNELDRLSAYLQQELDDADYAGPAEELLAKELRIEGAIHVITTLKSVNDRSLSDWQGVIGKELDQQREQQVEREEELRELVDRVESLYAAQASLAEPDHREWETAIRTELNTIRGDLRVLASQVGGVPVRLPKVERQTVTLPCPSCSESVTFSQKLKATSVKAHKCGHCGSPLMSRLEGGRLTLRNRVPLVEAIVCPQCESPLKATLDPIPGSSTKADCTNCGAKLRLIRRNAGVTARVQSRGSQGSPPPMALSPVVPLTEEILLQVKATMPPQPWPPGAAREVAAQLELPLKAVSQAIRQLMARGEFAYQVDGKLYRAVEASIETDNPSAS